MGMGKESDHGGHEHLNYISRESIERQQELYKQTSLGYACPGDGRAPVGSPVFKTVWWAAMQAAVGSTPIHSR